MEKTKSTVWKCIENDKRTDRDQETTKGTPKQLNKGKSKWIKRQEDMGRDLQKEIRYFKIQCATWKERLPSLHIQIIILNNDNNENNMTLSPFASENKKNK